MPDKLIIEDVPGTTWTTVRRAGSARLVLTRALPSRAPQEYTSAWTGYVRAELSGCCPACEAVASLPPGMKTAAQGEEFLTGMFLVHQPWCLFSPDTLRRVAPGGALPEADLSDEAVLAIGQHVDHIRREASKPRKQRTP